jgi:hypothetical protein
MQNEEPPNPKRTYSAPGTLKIPPGTLQVFGGILIGLGAGFLAFYRTVCVPQVEFMRLQNDRLTENVSKLNQSMSENNRVTQDLIRELKKQ